MNRYITCDHNNEINKPENMDRDRLKNMEMSSYRMRSAQTSGVEKSEGITLWLHVNSAKINEVEQGELKAFQLFTVSS